MSETNREYILRLFKIVSTTSILVVGKHGKVKRLNCPFRVMAHSEIPPDIVQGQYYWVDSVKMTLNLKEVFIIGGKGYYFGDFAIKGS